MCDGSDGFSFRSPHSIPRTDQYVAFVPPPVELPSGDAAGAALSPPPGYQGPGSWVPGHDGGYGSGAKP